MEEQWGTTECRGAIVPAFKLGRTLFYEFTDPSTMPFQRAIETMVELECVSMKFTRAQLEAHFEMCDKYVTGVIGKDVFVKHLVDCYDRLTWASAPETILRAAACWFFTKDESPYVVDPEYNKIKIQLFLEHARKMPDIFFSLINLTHFPVKLDKNILAFSRMEKSKAWMEELSTALNLSETHSLNLELRAIFPRPSRWKNIIIGWHLN
jgi:hypothetical protein